MTGAAESHTCTSGPSLVFRCAMATMRLPSARRTRLTVPDVECSWLMSDPWASSRGPAGAAGDPAGAREDRARGR